MRASRPVFTAIQLPIQIHMLYSDKIGAWAQLRSRSYLQLSLTKFIEIQFAVPYLTPGPLPSTLDYSSQILLFMQLMLWSGGVSFDAFIS